jgi:phosphoribosylaminoimidazolecarboxamide formyltransferase/IMP cyclohydrolase
MGKIRRALVSVSDKRGLEEFCRGLARMAVEIVSTGGTARALSAAGIPVRNISDLTGFPEILDGRVKTLHPQVHGGILYLRDNPHHREEVRASGIEDIDLVLVNLYPFEATVASGEATLEEAIAAAAARIKAAKLPLYGGMATDVDGCRAVVSLADKIDSLVGGFVVGAIVAAAGTLGQIASGLLTG